MKKYNAIFLSLRQEIKLVQTKYSKVIIIKDLDTSVETGIPNATKRDYKKLLELYSKFDRKRIEYEQSLADMTKRVVNKDE